jgi:hypothetical protein
MAWGLKRNRDRGAISSSENGVRLKEKKESEATKK